MRDILKRHAEIAASLMALCAVGSAIIVAFGGSVPPWAPASEFKQLRGQWDGFISERDATRCADAMRRLKNARMRLQARPGDTFEQENIDVTEMEIRRIPNCSER